MGKHARLWKKTRSEWIKAHPANHQGYYTCWLCGKWVDESVVTIDHVIPRSAAPHLRYEFDNLRPACFACNNKKGSKH